TYGGLRVERLDCDTNTPHGGCAPGGSIGVILTNSVKRKDFQKALTIEPPVKLRTGGGDGDEMSSYLGVVGKFEPGQTYSLSLAKDLVDEFGQPLGKAYTHSFKVDDYFPHAELGITGDTLISTATRPIEIGSVNVGSYDVLTAAVSPEELPTFLETENTNDRLERLATLKGTKRRKVTP